jgi:hypothetical protein
MTKLADVNPDTAGTELELTAQALSQQLGTALVIRSTADLEQAVIDRRTIGDAITRVETFFAPLKQMAYKLHATLCDRERTILAPLRAVDTTRRTAISDYKAAQDAARREQELVLAAQAQREEQARAAAEAAALEGAGHRELADAVLAEAINAPAPIVTVRDETADVAGLNFRRRWLWRYAGGPKDVTATPPQVIARTMKLIPREFLMIDTRKVGAYAKAMKTAANIPGIEIYSVDDPVR